METVARTCISHLVYQRIQIAKHQLSNRWPGVAFIAENVCVKSNGLPGHLNHVVAEFAAHTQNRREADHSFVAYGRHFNLWAIRSAHQHGHHTVQGEIDVVDGSVLQVQLPGILERNNRGVLGQRCIIVRG